MPLCQFPNCKCSFWCSAFAMALQTVEAPKFHDTAYALNPYGDNIGAIEAELQKAYDMGRQAR